MVLISLRYLLLYLFSLLSIIITITIITIIIIIIIIINYNEIFRLYFLKHDNYHRPRIKPIANRDMIPEIRGEDCDPFRVIRGEYFSFNEYSFICYFFNYINSSPRHYKAPNNL